MAKVRVRVFTCDWPGCAAVLRVPCTTERRAKAYVWKRGWLWTSDETGMHFCGAAASGRRDGHARRMLAEHRPSLTRLPSPEPGWSVACWCGWPASEPPAEPPASSAAEARTRWARHLPVPGGPASGPPRAPRTARSAKASAA